MLALIFALIFGGAAAAMIFLFWKAYLSATGTTWQRILAAAQGSATIAWARFSAFVGMAATALASLADWLNAPGVSDGIKEVLQPQYVALFIIVSGILTELARRRTL